jgi:dihydropteroate synthase
MARAALWTCGSHVFDLATPKIMGILNVTPDSFSDGGAYASTQAAIERGLEMVKQGAALIDVGGQSTRPGSVAPSAEEEAARAIPVVEALASQGVAVSIDTYQPSVAAAALDAGACIVNDITGFTNGQMVEIAATSTEAPGLIVMHMQIGRAHV